MNPPNPNNDNQGPSQLRSRLEDVRRTVESWSLSKQAEASATVNSRTMAAHYEVSSDTESS